MARALVSGLSKMPGVSIAVLDRHPEKLESLKKNYGVETYEKPGDWISKADIVVLAVKPQGLKEFCASVKDFISKDSTVLSIAAGVPAKPIAEWTDSNRVVRSIPNTPAMVGKGLTGLYAAETLSEEDRMRAQTVTDAVGRSLWVDDEARLHLVTAGPGSGPSYVFLFMEAFADGLKDLGVDEVTAKEFALSTVEGAAALARASGEEFAILRANVTSKGGTTAKAIEVLEANNIRTALKEAVFACRKRSEEMGVLFG